MNPKLILSFYAAFLLASLAEGNEGSSHVVAKTLYLEARGEGERGLRAVASVIWNRAHYRKMSLAQVCLQRKQFECWSDRKPSGVKIEYGDPGWRLCLKIEAEMMSQTFAPINDWDLYHNPKKASPSWGGKGLNVTKIGNHVFEKERKG